MDIRTPVYKLPLQPACILIRQSRGWYDVVILYRQQLLRRPQRVATASTTEISAESLKEPEQSISGRRLLFRMSRAPSPTDLFFRQEPSEKVTMSEGRLSEASPGIELFAFRNFLGGSLSQSEVPVQVVEALKEKRGWERQSPGSRRIQQPCGRGENGEWN